MDFLKFLESKSFVEICKTKRKSKRNNKILPLDDRRLAKEQKAKKKQTLIIERKNYESKSSIIAKG